MTSKTSKTIKSISLTVNKEFIQYCKLNDIEDIEKAAKETFKRGFDLLKYGTIPESELTSQDKEKVVPEPSKRVIPTVPPEEREKLNEGVDVKTPTEKPPEIIEAIPLKSSDAKEEFTKMGVIPKKRDKKTNLYDE